MDVPDPSVEIKVYEPPRSRSTARAASRRVSVDTEASVGASLRRASVVATDRQTDSSSDDDERGTRKVHLCRPERQRVVHVRLGARHVHHRRDRLRGGCPAGGVEVGVRTERVFDVFGRFVCFD